MSDIDILREMISNSAIVTLEDNYGKRTVVLTEQGISSSATIFGIPENAIVIKADNFRSPDSIFSCSRGECKRADFVVIAATDKKKVILCIELKKTTDSEKSIIQQLTGAKCFVAYCREIGQEFWNQPKFLEDYVYRYISIRRTSIAKKKTRTERKSKVHDRPERMMKISSPHHLQFNQLAGK